MEKDTELKESLDSTVPVRPRDFPRRLEILIILLGILGYIVFFTQYDRAFPEAALHLDLSKDEIAQKARQVIAEYGYDLSEYEFTLTFSGGNTFYLERTLGIPAANQLIEDEKLPIWSWNARWFKPLEEEEFSLALAPDGEVLGFSHHIPEAEYLPELDGDQAQQVVEDYLVNSLGWNLDDWELVSSSSSERLGGRIDHNFVWKRTDFEVGESELRISAGIQGERVGNYNYWLETPDAFWREYQEKADLARAIDSWSTTLGYNGFLLIAALAAGFLLLRGTQVWRRAIFPALLYGGVSLLSSLNYLPLYKAYYSTTERYWFFWVDNVAGIFFSALTSTLYFFMLFTGALSLSKLIWPLKDTLLPRRVPRRIMLARSVGRGLMVAGIHSGYVVGFYFLATQILGGWSPMGVSYSNAYATPFPFLPPLRSGLLAGLEEETIFRLIGIAAILWLMPRRRWIAVLVPGVLWALAHLTYVRDPFYMRGIELLVVAVFYGVIFLKFDLTTTIVAHATYNALLGALPMLRSGESYYLFSGVIVILVLVSPALPGLILWLKQRAKLSPSEAPVIRLAEKAGHLDWNDFQADGLEDWDAYLRNPQTVVVCLAYRNKVVGAAVGLLDDNDQAHILHVQVHPDWRNQYWGSRMVFALQEELKVLGADNVSIETDLRDRTSVAFWAAQGWRPVRRTFSQAEFPTLGGFIRQGWALFRGKDA